jgi:hypothetical protein
VPDTESSKRIEAATTVSELNEIVESRRLAWGSAGGRQALQKIREIQLPAQVSPPWYRQRIPWIIAGIILVALVVLLVLRH